jgi:hypothetical protein
MKNKVSASTIKKVRASIVRTCLKLGVDSPKTIRSISNQATKGIALMSIAGYKATRPDGTHTYRAS